MLEVGHIAVLSDQSLVRKLFFDSVNFLIFFLLQQGEPSLGNEDGLPIFMLVFQECEILEALSEQAFIFASNQPVLGAYH